MFCTSAQDSEVCKVPFTCGFVSMHLSLIKVEATTSSGSYLCSSATLFQYIPQRDSCRAQSASVAVQTAKVSTTSRMLARQIGQRESASLAAHWTQATMWPHGAKQVRMPAHAGEGCSSLTRSSTLKTRGPMRRHGPCTAASRYTTT